MQTSDNEFGTTIRSLPAVGEENKPVFHKIRESVANGINKAADVLHSQADQTQVGDFSNLGHKTAGWLERSADYVNQLEPQQLRTDIEDHVRKNPARSLLIAGAAGLVLGAIFRRR